MPALDLTGFHPPRSSTSIFHTRRPLDQPPFGARPTVSFPITYANDVGSVGCCRCTFLWRILQTPPVFRLMPSLGTEPNSKSLYFYKLPQLGDDRFLYLPEFATVMFLVKSISNYHSFSNTPFLIFHHGYFGYLVPRKINGAGLRGFLVLRGRQA